MSLAVLNLYRCCIFCFTIHLALLLVFNVKVKNLAFDTSAIITNAWFSMNNYTACVLGEHSGSCFFWKAVFSDYLLS